MRFKKRYLLLVLILIWWLVVQSGCLSMRKSEAAQRADLQQKGQWATPEFGFYDVDGKSIHYARIGSPDLPVLLIVHGSPGAGSDFLDYLADTTLTKRMQVVAIDRLGFGWSDYGHAETDIDKQTAVLLPLLQRFAQHRVILMGHSYGGPVVARAAMRYPDLVDGVVIVAGSVDPELEPAIWWKQPFDLPVIRTFLPAELRVSNREILPLRWELERIKPDWALIRCPVTVIQGTKDNLVPAGNAEYARQHLTHNPDVKIKMIENEGHFLVWSMRQMVLDEVFQLVE